MDCFQKKNVTSKNLKSQLPKPVCQRASVCQKVILALEAASAQQDTQVFLGLLQPSCPHFWSSLDWKQNLPPKVEMKAEVWKKVRMNTFSSSGGRTDQNLDLCNFLEASLENVKSATPSWRGGAGSNPSDSVCNQVGGIF